MKNGKKLKNKCVTMHNISGRKRKTVRFLTQLNTIMCRKPSTDPVCMYYRGKVRVVGTLTDLSPSTVTASEFLPDTLDEDESEEQL